LNFKVARKRAEFLVFWPNFGKKIIKLRDRNYKIDLTADHAAKLHGDRLREFEDLVAKTGK